MSKTSDMHIQQQEAMRQCLECKEDYEVEDMPFDLCPDCQDDFNSGDAEYQLERAMHLGDLKRETPPSKG